MQITNIGYLIKTKYGSATLIATCLVTFKYIIKQKLESFNLIHWFRKGINYEYIFEMTTLNI